jgi:hypothetical protein
VATEGTRLSAHSAHRRAKRREALEASVELCGWAVVYDEAQRGKSKRKVIRLVLGNPSIRLSG